MPSGSQLPPIIVKQKRRRSEPAHGSSTWKIALADFMTALFIIFLALWLINQVTVEQRIGIADYFSPAPVSRTKSGSDGLLGGQRVTPPGPVTADTAQVSPRAGGPSSAEAQEGSTQVPGFPGKSVSMADAAGGAGKPADVVQRPAPDLGLQAVENALRGLAVGDGIVDQGNLRLERVDEGLRIELIDSARRELFASGSALPLAHTRELMRRVAQVIEPLPNRLTIAGHTDAIPFTSRAGYSNWELSLDRANASRRLLVESGVAEDRISAVSGKADRDALIPMDPSAPANRRISITLLRELQSEPGATR